MVVFFYVDARGPVVSLDRAHRKQQKNDERDWISDSLGLQEELLAEGLVLPPVPFPPVATVVPVEVVGVATGFKGEVQQVVQANLLGTRELGRAELCPLGLCYLEEQQEGPLSRHRQQRQKTCGCRLENTPALFSRALKMQSL